MRLDQARAAMLAPGSVQVNTGDWPAHEAWRIIRAIFEGRS